MQSTETTSTRNRRRRVVAVIGAGVLSLAVAGTASAKEIASGGTPVPAAATCSPVSSLTTKGDPRVGETGLASVDVNYSVKACDKNPVTVTLSVYLSSDPTQVVYVDTAAALSNRVTVFGIRIRTSYIAKVEVFDATTGASVGSATAYAGATPKNGV